MARPNKEPPFSSSLVPAIVRYAQARGLDVEALAWRFGLPRNAGLLDEVTTGVDVPSELLHAIERALGLPDVALQVASDLSSRRHALAELAVRASATIRDALRRLARWAPLLHEGLQASLEDSEARRARWVLHTPRRPRGVGRHLQELAIAYAIHQVRAGAGPVSPMQIWFAHPRPPALAALQTFFGTEEIAFGCESSGFTMEASELGRAMRFADARTVETIAPLVEATLAARPPISSFAERIEVHVASSLPDGTNVGAVARAMRMSSRTLQRRLEQEATRFSEVLDRARLAVARRLLGESNATLTEVAFRLGFADLATFSRAFKRWTGTPPGQWRRS